MTNVISLNNVTVRYQSKIGLFSDEYFVALKNITLDIKQGETVGIIGRNGCGKSTLLKIFAGIIEPDSGSVSRHKEKISLLSLGAGFDPNLSGRDNAIISAMMLGCSKKIALERLNSVLEYSELGTFFEQPVKTYSTGMVARLGFTIAVQMDVDVLLIDEVLGVGDANFVKKAEQTIMEKVKSKDTTVVLVSHSAQQIRDICERAYWLNDGIKVAEGSVEKVTSLYESFLDNIYIKDNLK